MKSSRPAILATAAALLSPSSVLLSSTSAAAHDSLLRSSPIDGGRLDVPPRRIVLLFSDDVVPESARLTVDGPRGRLPAYTSRVDRARIVQQLPTDLTAGGYVATWRVVSSDGHPISGRVSFSVLGDTTARVKPPVDSPSPTKTSVPNESQGEPTGAPAPEPQADASVFVVGGGLIAAALSVLAASAVVRWRRRRTAREGGAA